MCLMGIEGQESAAAKHVDYRVEERLRGGIRFEDLTERNIWPSAESDLRRAPTSARPAAHFDAARGSEVGRVEGYRLAAEVLVRYMVRHRGNRDFLIYPFIRKAADPPSGSRRTYRGAWALPSLPSKT